MIWAKAYISGAAAGSALCQVVAGTDTDSTLGSGIAFGLATLVVHEFAAAGTVEFRCSSGGTQTAAQIKIAAIRVANLTNSG